MIFLIELSLKPLMSSLIGEFDCKVDAKGRFMFPINLRKQLENSFDQGFVINRNLHQKCLVLYLDNYKVNDTSILIFLANSGGLGLFFQGTASQY